jgi:hypothetical protein
MNIELSGTERQLLHEILSQEMTELRGQVYHAEAPRFKDELKKRKDEVQLILDKLPS